MVSEKRLKKLSNPDYRQEYLKATLTAWVVNQLKTLRRQRKWTQQDVAERADTPQSGIARAESEDYGSWSTNTLLALAKAFDVALEIRFVPWTQYMRDMADTSPERMEVPSFSEAAFEVQPTVFQKAPANKVDTSNRVIRLSQPQQVQVDTRPVLMQ